MAEKLQDTQKFLFCHLLFFTSPSNSFYSFRSVYLGRKADVTSASFM